MTPRAKPPRELPGPAPPPSGRLRLRCWRRNIPARRPSRSSSLSATSSRRQADARGNRYQKRSRGRRPLRRSGGRTAGCRYRPLERLRDILNARAQAATAAAMSEQHDPGGTLGNNQFALQAHRIGRYQCLASAYVRLTHGQRCRASAVPPKRDATLALLAPLASSFGRKGDIAVAGGIIVLKCSGLHGSSSQVASGDWRGATRSGLFFQTLRVLDFRND